MKKFIIILSLFAFLFSGCGSGGEGGGEQPKASIEVSLLSSGELVSAGKKYEIVVKCSSSTTWTVSASEAWVKIEPTSGKGETVCSMTLSENLGAERTATVTAKTATNVEGKYTFTQSGPRTVTISPDDITFNAANDPVEVLISTKSTWKITNAADASWVTFSKTSGEGGETITVKPLPNTDRAPRGPVNIKIESGSTVKNLKLFQDLPNTAPNSFSVIASPAAKIPYTDQIVFGWNAATDPENDPIVYEIQFSQNNNTWETIATDLTSTSFTMPDNKLGKDQYYWRIVAKDAFGGTTTSDVGILKVDYLHYDNMVYVYQENKVAGCPPINILFIGDGYIASDYNYNGDFDKHLKTSIDGFFSLEPYKTYKDYFKVTVAVAYSKDQGVTVLEDFSSGSVKAQTKDTRFQTKCAGGKSTAINITSQNFFRDYVNNLLGVGEPEINSWTILMSVNVNAWAGTCTMSRTGFSIARSAVDYNLARRMAHEGAGHGFAKLSDEYIDESGTVPQSVADQLVADRNTYGGVWAWRANTDVTGDRNLVHWKHYFDLPIYKDAVGLYEGCWHYPKGVWRAEDTSIMQGSSASGGFNAPSREAIVRRIMNLIGKEFVFADFLAKDKSDPVSRSAVHYVDPNIRDTPPEVE